MINKQIKTLDELENFEWKNGEGLNFKIVKNHTTGKFLMLIESIEKIWVGGGFIYTFNLNKLRYYGLNISLVVSPSEDFNKWQNYIYLKYSVFTKIVDERTINICYNPISNWDTLNYPYGSKGISFNSNGKISTPHYPLELLLEIEKLWLNNGESFGGLF